MTTISREYTFSAAHRIEGHPKCGRMHGHNYRVVVNVAGPVGPDGMVLDFGELDKVVKPLFEAFDHRYIVSDQNVTAEDEYAELALKRGDAIHPNISASTAECLAYFFANEVTQALLSGVMPKCSVGIEVHETEKNVAYYD